jgi:hypothetical protein
LLAVKAKGALQGEVGGEALLGFQSFNVFCRLGAILFIESTAFVNWHPETAANLNNTRFPISNLFIRRAVSNIQLICIFALALAELNDSIWGYYFRVLVKTGFTELRYFCCLV